MLAKNNQREQLKLIYRIKTAAGFLKTKVLKMDENNQYGSAMTKPLPYGSIKNKWKKNYFLARIQYDS